jgi:hypothetical protein
MPQQPLPQSPPPDGPTSSSPTAHTNGATPQSGVPPQPVGRATPPDGYAWSNGYGAAPVPGRASASDGFGGVKQQGRPLQGPPPGYGPVGPPPAYRPAPPARPTQAFPASAPSEAATAAVAAAEPKKRDLTVNKLVAGAGAAATSAVLGSFFGAMGTVTGAAVGSVFSALVTSLMQHSLDKTRDTVKAKVKLPGGSTVKVSGTTEVPAPRGTSDQASTRVFVTAGDPPTEVISAVPAVDAGPPKSRRRLLVMTGFAVVVFAIGMLAVTGLELMKGSPLNTSSSSTTERPGGTSLGTVLGRSESAGTETSTETPSETAEPTSEATTSDDPADEESDTSAEPRTGFGADEEEPTSESDPTPTSTPESGADEQSDEGSQSGGGAAREQGVAGADEQQ